MINQQLYPSYPIALLGPEWTDKRNRRVTGIWVSKNPSVEKAATPEGYLNHLEQACAAAVGSPVTPGDISIKLQPVTNHLNEIKTGKRVLLHSINFYSLHVRSAGGAGYTADQINAVIDASLNDAVTGHNYAYNQGGLRLTPLASHQPNWFRPKFIVNRAENIFSTIDQTDPDANIPDGDTSYDPDLSIGLDIPYYYPANMEFDSITAIDVYAQCLQAIRMSESAIVYQNYPIVCNAHFIVQP